jgi:SNF2 family DNA or RNA helicase
MKNSYGITSWGSWFIDVLNSYGMGGRLDRGRTYANTGKVLSLKLEAGRVVAKVKGNYRPSYQVEIIFSPLKEAELVYKMIDEDPLLLAHIASGELPEIFLQKLKQKNISLIPRHWREMKKSCTCPDEYGDPCKHLAALYFIIAREIDTDPHLLFRLRGMDLAARFGKSAVQRILPPFTINFKENVPPALPEQSTQLVVRPSPPVLEEIPNCVNLITALLPSAPSFCKRDFAVVMAEFYHRTAHYKAWEAADITEQAETEHNFSRSVWTIYCPESAPGATLFLDARDIDGNIRRFTPCGAFEYFVRFSSEDGTSSYSFLFYFFKFFNLLCSASAFIPYVLVKGKTLKIIWRPFETLPDVKKILDAISAIECGMLNTVSGRSVVDLLASAFLNEWVYRRSLAFRKSFGRQSGGQEYLELLNLFFYETEIDVSAPSRRSLPQAIDRWLSVLHIDFTAHHYSLTIKDAHEKRAFGTDFKFSLSMDVIIDAPAEEKNKTQKIPLCQCKNLEALKAPIALSNYLPEIRLLASASEKTQKGSVELSQARLVNFLESASLLLSRLGMTVELPKSLHRELKPRLLVKGDTASKCSGSLKRYLDLNVLQDFEWQIAVEDEVISIQEFEKLVKQKQDLVRFRDGFIKIDTEEFARLLKKAKNTKPDLNDFLKAHFSGDTILAFDTRKIIDNLFREQSLPIPNSLKAELRSYQKRGFNWVCSLLFSGFGCILADDMGLGKTVQSIAALLRLNEDGLLDKGCLVVAPASLLSNWEKELERFAPSLLVSRFHGPHRIINREFNVFLTTYQTAVRDVEKLKDVAFSLLLVDEAHLMKNAETRISRAVKLLQSKYRLALSGTPVENRLEDLRSLFDFIIPGYLGSAKDFQKQYRVPIEVMRSREQAEALRKITAPFLLRRLKTDKAIIKDLPEKIVANEYAVLEKNQAALYESVVSESVKKSAEMESWERSSLILSLLTSLKQICDHPRVFDKESPAVSALSGKAQLLLTLLEEILASREKVLVFSQYVETLNCLDLIIRNEMKEAALVYHGGLKENVRTALVDRFQNDPASRIFLVSLKAGGLGLNLTAASRVIHYDLWYNPAVENQATDRAFRIGQKHNVFVHRFITKNSFEEKIDVMISGKKELAEMTVASGESWLARMSHEELKDLFNRDDKP